MKQGQTVLVLGSKGLVGSAITRELDRRGYNKVLTPVREELDLTQAADVDSYISSNKPDIIFLAAAKVGGIFANDTYRADFIYENLLIQTNVIGSALRYDVPEFVFLGSSCIYPKHCPQPIKEDYLLTGALEPTNEPYAIAKIAGLKLVENIRRQYGKKYFSVMPTNLYGPNDNYDLKNSHVIPGLIARMDQARKNDDKVFKVWGSGKPRREFLYVDDLAEACVFLAEKSETTELPDLINIGTGEDVDIATLASYVRDTVGYSGDLVFDTSMPDGTPQKLLDVSLINSLGWKAKTQFKDGLTKAFEDYSQLRSDNSVS